MTLVLEIFEVKGISDSPLELEDNLNLSPVLSEVLFFNS